MDTFFKAFKEGERDQDFAIEINYALHLTVSSYGGTRDFVQ